MGRRYIMKKPRGPRGEYDTPLKAARSEIATRLAAGVSSGELAREFGCSRDTINEVRRLLRASATSSSDRADPTP